MIMVELLPEGVYLEGDEFCAGFDKGSGDGWVRGNPETGNIALTWEDAKLMVPELVEAALRAGLKVEE